MDAPEEVLGVLAQGCARGSGEALFSALDERSRFALIAIAEAHQKARRLISEQYPRDARPDALAELGSDSDAQSGAELFGRRCTGACLAQLCDRVGAPEQVVTDGGLARVRTVRGGEYLLYRTAQGRFGVVFDTEALHRERRRAFAQLSLVEANAKVYARQKALR